MDAFSSVQSFGYWSSTTDNVLVYNLWYTNPLFALIGAAYGVAGRHKLTDCNDETKDKLQIERNVDNPFEKTDFDESRRK